MPLCKFANIISELVSECEASLQKKSDRINAKLNSTTTWIFQFEVKGRKLKDLILKVHITQ